MLKMKFHFQSVTTCKEEGVENYSYCGKFKVWLITKLNNINFKQKKSPGFYI